jgi:hypothetical protein
MWLAGQYRPAVAAVAFIYRPLLLARQNDIDARDALDWYLGLWSRRGWFRVGSHHVFWFENDGRDGQMPSQQNIPPRP